VELTKDQLITVLMTALECFRADFDPDITAARINTLLAVSKESGMQQVDVARFVKGLSTSGISRNVMDWSELDTKRRPGPEFVQQRPDPQFRRRNLLFVTPKGSHFLDRLTNHINKALAPKKGKTN